MIPKASDQHEYVSLSLSFIGLVTFSAMSLRMRAGSHLQTRQNKVSLDNGLPPTQYRRYHP